MNTPNYITDNEGNKLSVVLSIEDYKILEELEELEDIHLYDEAMASKEVSLPVDSALVLLKLNAKNNALSNFH